jgi:hypothetical protein
MIDDTLLLETASRTDTSFNTFVYKMIFIPIPKLELLCHVLY